MGRGRLGGRVGLTGRRGGRAGRDLTLSAVPAEFEDGLVRRRVNANLGLKVVCDCAMYACLVKLPVFESM